MKLLPYYEIAIISCLANKYLFPTNASPSGLYSGAIDIDPFKSEVSLNHIRDTSSSSNDTCIYELPLKPNSKNHKFTEFSKNKLDSTNFIETNLNLKTENEPEKNLRNQNRGTIARKACFDLALLVGKGNKRKNQPLKKKLPKLNEKTHSALKVNRVQPKQSMRLRAMAIDLILFAICD